MSFSGQVKEELCEVIGSSRHCKLAELGALYTMSDDAEGSRASAKLDRLSDMLKLELGTEQGDKALKIVKDAEDNGIIVDRMLVSMQCCKQAYIRGAFIASGSVTDPEKGYHLEFTCSSRKKAELLASIIQAFDIEAKIIDRKRAYVCYIKDGTSIVDILNVMGAYVSLMNMENVRILKEVRNSVNRKVNCETANLNKTVSAAVRQIEDIRYIEQTKGLKFLPESLRQLAVLRLEEPEMSLVDLGQEMNPPLGKSGVNHRLRKISEIANELRSQVLSGEHEV